MNRDTDIMAKMSPELAQNFGGVSFTSGFGVSLVNEWGNDTSPKPDMDISDDVDPNNELSYPWRG